jgi:hypothetical protein
MERDDSQEPEAGANREQWARFGLQQAQSHMSNQKGISHIHEHVQSLPHGRGQVPEPKVVARRCHEEKNHESEKAQLLKWEIREASEILIRSQQTAALLVVGEGPESLLSMWQPYAILHLLGKPVELVMLNTTEHDLSNPAVRLASQGGSVDWFRFWLKGEEDPDPAKAEQYKRWRELRKLQEQNEKKSPAPAI